MVYPQFVPVNSISKRTDLPEKRTKWLHSSAEEDCRIRCRLLKACRLELESELEWLPPDLGGGRAQILIIPPQKAGKTVNTKRRWEKQGESERGREREREPRPGP